MLFSVPKFLKSLWGGHDPLSRTRVRATTFLSAPIINGAGQPAQRMKMAHSQLLRSKVTSQVLLHFLGLERAKKRVKYSRVKLWEGSQIPNWREQEFTSLLPLQAQIQHGTPCSFCTLQIRKRLCHLWFCVLLQKRKLMLKEHVLKENLSSPMANRPL